MPALVEVPVSLTPDIAQRAPRFDPSDGSTAAVRTSVHRIRDDIAQLIHTAGSTGRPEGLAITRAERPRIPNGEYGVVTISEHVAALVRD
jgi:hypothetical protein